MRKLAAIGTVDGAWVICADFHLVRGTMLLREATRINVRIAITHWRIAALIDESRPRDTAGPRLNDNTPYFSAICEFRVPVEMTRFTQPLLCYTIWRERKHD